LRIIGLDIGSRRIGVAVSDELGLTAQTLTTLESKTPEQDVERIAGIVKEQKATEIVVGIPYNMDGTEGPQARKVRAIMRLINHFIKLPLHEWDERLSTVAAERTLLEADLSRSKRRKVIDKLAAAIILQGYLDSQNLKNRLTT